MAKPDENAISDLESEEATEARLDAAAEAAVAAGRVVLHERVREWLTKLANGERVPPPCAWPVRVVWTEPARDDIDRTHDYLVDINAHAATHVAVNLRKPGDSLEHFPRRGRPVSGTNMGELVASHRYLIRYRIAGDVVVILRVRHSSRRPTVP